MIYLGAVAALAALWLNGALFLAVLGLRTRSDASALALDFVAGAALLAFLGTVLVASGLRLSLAPFYLLMMALVVLAGWRRQWIRLSVAPPRSRLAVVLLTIAGLIVLAFLTSAASDRLWWDGWAIWALKARVLFVDGTLPRPFLDPEGIFRFADPDYPLAVPLVEWWLFSHAGTSAPALASITGTVWFGLVALLTWGALGPRVGETVAAAATLGITAFWPLAFFGSGGGADIVIAVALLGATVEMQRAFGDDDRAALWRAAIFLSLGALAKNEGLALALSALIVGLALVLIQRRRVAERLLALVVPFLALAPWLAFTWSLGLRSTVTAQVMGVVPSPATALPGAAGMLEVIGANAWLLLGKLGKLVWSAPWRPLPFLAGVGLIAAFRVRRPGLRLGWAVLGLQFAAVCAAYTLTPGRAAWILSTSLGRVMTSFVPALVFLSLIGAVATLAPRPSAPAMQTRDDGVE